MATYCDWCGSDAHLEDDHTVLANLHMHTRAPIELCEDALAVARPLVNGGTISDRSYGDDEYQAAQRLWAIAEDIETLSEDERDDLDVTSEILDDIEDAVCSTGRLLAISDGGGTGDWLMLDVPDFPDEDETFPIEWNAWRLRWDAWLERHRNELGKASHTFPADKNLLADEILGTYWTPNGDVELSEVTFPDLTGERRGQRNRYVGVTFAPDADAEDRTPLVSTFAELCDVLGIAREVEA